MAIESVGCHRSQVPSVDCLQSAVVTIESVGRRQSQFAVRQLAATVDCRLILQFLTADSRLETENNQSTASSRQSGASARRYHRMTALRTCRSGSGTTPGAASRSRWICFAAEPLEQVGQLYEKLGAGPPQAAQPQRLRGAFHTPQKPEPSFSGLRNRFRGEIDPS